MGSDFKLTHIDYEEDSYHDYNDRRRTALRRYRRHLFSSNIFKELGIDFCCGGQRTLSEAVQKRMLDEQAVLNRLNKVCTEERPTWPLDWRESEGKLKKLSEHIRSNHHDFLRSELPVLRDFVNKVARVHGDHHPELKELERLYLALSEELLEHVDKEDRKLFPAVRKAEEEGSAEALQAAIDILDVLEDDMFTHVHLENNLLFPELVRMRNEKQ